MHPWLHELGELLGKPEMRAEKREVSAAQGLGDCQVAQDHFPHTSRQGREKVGVIHGIRYQFGGIGLGIGSDVYGKP